LPILRDVLSTIETPVLKLDVAEGDIDGGFFDRRYHSAEARRIKMPERWQ
jgi:hypothetical protein